MNKLLLLMVVFALSCASIGTKRAIVTTFKGFCAMNNLRDPVCDFNAIGDYHPCYAKLPDGTEKGFTCTVNGCQ